MNKQSLLYLFGIAALAGCTTLPGFSEGQTGNGYDSYFVTNVGRLAGHAEAIASICPSLSFNAAELEMRHVAICQGQGLEDNCALPGLTSEKDSAFAETVANLSATDPAEVCADTRADAQADPSLAAFLNGI